MRAMFVLVVAIANVSLAAAQPVAFVSESITDLGRLADPPAAEILALGGMGTFGFETAADGVMNPAALIRGPRSDVIVAAAVNRVSRDVFLRTTTDANGIATHEQHPITGPWSTTGFFAAAIRRQQWAIGAFYDGSTKLRHRFVTGERTISQISSPGGAAFSQLTGRTESSTQIDLSRIGASFAIAAFGRRVAVGGSVEAIRFHADVHSASALAGLSIVRGQPTVRSSSIETGELTSDQWKTGLTIAGVGYPIPSVGISIVRRWMPTFAATLFGMRRSVTFAFEEPFSQRLTVDVPDLFTIGGTFATAATKVGGEIVRIDYGILKNNELRSPVANLLRPAGTGVEGRAGIQHRLSIGASRRLIVRAGLASEGVHALSTERPDRFIPEPRIRTWITGGVGLEVEQVTFAVSAGRTRDEHRINITVGFRGR